MTQHALALGLSNRLDAGRAAIIAAAIAATG
jgi:hypothetical protein